MSWEIHLEIDTGGYEPATVYNVGNYTYNVAPMYEKAIGSGLNELNGQMAGGLISLLERGISDMWKFPDIYKKLNPVNGWGSYEGAINYLEDLLKACRLHPRAIVRVD